MNLAPFNETIERILLFSHSSHFFFSVLCALEDQEANQKLVGNRLCDFLLSTFPIGCVCGSTYLAFKRKKELIFIGFCRTRRRHPWCFFIPLYFFFLSLSNLMAHSIRSLFLNSVAVCIYA